LRDVRLSSISDRIAASGEWRDGPKADSYTAAKSILFDHVVRVVMLETAYGGLKQRERDFREKEREEDKAIFARRTR
jgi:hypothetical protein